MHVYCLGCSCQEAAEKALAHMSERVGSSGGLVVVNPQGDVGQAFTTERMAWAWARGVELHSGLNHGDDVMEMVNSKT